MVAQNASISRSRAPRRHRKPLGGTTGRLNAHIREVGFREFEDFKGKKWFADPVVGKRRYFVERSK